MHKPSPQTPDRFVSGEFSRPTFFKNIKILLYTDNLRAYITRPFADIGLAK